MTETEEIFTAYITKYALTTGIYERRVQCSGISASMVSVLGGRNEYYHGSDWHRTKTAAIVRAKQMQAAKLKSIDRKRARIAALKFE